MSKKRDEGDDFVIELEIEGRNYFRKKRIRLPKGFTLSILQRDGGQLRESFVVSGFSGVDDTSVTVDSGGVSRLKKRFSR